MRKTCADVLLPLQIQSSILYEKVCSETLAVAVTGSYGFPVVRSGSEWVKRRLQAATNTWGLVSPCPYLVVGFGGWVWWFGR